MLTDRQWKKIEPLLPVLEGGPKGGRPWRNNRECFEGILWLLRSGARWKDMPDEYPSPATCWRRLKRWEEDGTWLKIWRTFLGELDQKGKLEWPESFIDGSFVPAKGGVWPLGRLREARVRNG